ncbi:carbohydrate sulfotransferase 14-like [Saccoglossus kowalevskii]|uniref:Carbohydrate sulfotransferase n=1 Tax=Saccoglossus kowalevskii TaxID=10224 RepID=A0ABM0LY72_SACKO|nr:PREDICTED: carbohydrate sulfotransferase 14-like [Saccoglossus kowalevskii]
MAVLPFEARNGGRFCLLMLLGMTMGVFMMIYISMSDHETPKPRSRVTLNHIKTTNIMDVKRETNVSREVPNHTYMDRLNLVESNCNTPTVELPVYKLQQLIVDDEYKFIYCWIPKVASGNWKVVLKNLKEFYTNKDWKPNLRDRNMGLPTLNKYSSVGIKTRLKSYYKYVFVRHPLERLLSAYRDRFERRRTNISRLPITNLSSFVNYIKDTMNIHWSPMTDLCDPCDIKFDFIGHFETLRKDVDYLLNLFNISSVASFRSVSSYATNSSDQSLLHKYYSSLSEDDMLFLQGLYAKDYQLFGYDPQI